MVAAMARVKEIGGLGGIGGLAVFVKTPGLSPIKTRLAADIGAAAAMDIYEKMLTASAKMMHHARESGVATYWAVGEREGVSHPRWREFPAVFTGEGGLGLRLHRIYSLLLRRHGCAALAGADCPALTAETTVSALHSAQNGEIAVGPTTDGGFYLFASRRRIPKRIWTSVAYSQSDTLANLLQYFPAAKIARLPTESDVDDADSLRAADFGESP